MVLKLEQDKIYRYKYSMKDKNFNSFMMKMCDKKPRKCLSSSHYGTNDYKATFEDIEGFWHWNPHKFIEVDSKGNDIITDADINIDIMTYSNIYELECRIEEEISKNNNDIKISKTEAFYLMECLKKCRQQEILPDYNDDIEEE